MRSLRVRSKEYTSARPPTPMRKVAGSIAVVTEELQQGDVHSARKLL